MPHVYCAAVNCNSDSRRKEADVDFFPLPKQPNLLRTWLKLLRRDGLEEKLYNKSKSTTSKKNADLRHLVVCSKHFIEGKPTERNPHPTIFDFNNKIVKKRKTLNSVTGRSVCDLSNSFNSVNPRSCSKKVRLVKCPDVDHASVCYPWVAGETDISVSESGDEVPIETVTPTEQVGDHSYACKEPTLKYNRFEHVEALERECEELREEVKSLKEENASLKKQLDDCSLKKEFVKAILKDDSTVRHFLGLLLLVFFWQFIEFVSNLYGKILFWKGCKKGGDKKWQEKKQKKPGVKVRKLSMKEEFILVMLKFRLALDNMTLSQIFNVSVSHVSNIFNTWMNFLSQILNCVIKWPSKEKVKKHMPLCFKQKYPNTVGIIDCTEVFVQKPKNSAAQASTWSNYKTKNTLKALVAIQPNGAFSFVSKFWSGNISDRKITEKSGFLDKVQKGDHIMADRGFQIRDLLTAKGAYLNMPPFTRASNKGKGRTLTSKEIAETRKIASVRIHVERAIQRLKTFKLLGHTLPLNMKEISSEMLTVAAAFCNFLPPLVKKYKG